jgi:large-conductance mechanosensitive channel
MDSFLFFFISWMIFLILGIIISIKSYEKEKKREKKWLEDTEQRKKEQIEYLTKKNE